MKKLKFSKAYQLIAASIAFTMILLIIRICYTGSILYLFYPWNIFIATIPVFFSTLLKKEKRLTVKSVAFFTCWLLFFPNAPYILTDVFHFEARLPVPPWFDLALVLSGAWTGMVLCIFSLMQIERWLQHFVSPYYRNFFMVFIMILGGLGMYMGRYERYNTWDIVTEPTSISSFLYTRIVHPFEHVHVWLFTLVFGVFTALIYFTVKAVQNNGYRDR